MHTKFGVDIIHDNHVMVRTRKQGTRQPHPTPTPESNPYIYVTFSGDTLKISFRQDTLFKCKSKHNIRTDINLKEMSSQQYLYILIASHITYKNTIHILACHLVYLNMVD